MIVRVETLEQARRRFLVVRDQGSAGPTSRWRCTTCGWESVADVRRVPEPHRCAEFRVGVPRPGRHFGSDGAA